MTLKEFIDEITKYTWLDDDKMDDFSIIMVGRNENGERLYKIDVKDITFNFDEKIIRLWDT